MTAPAMTANGIVMPKSLLAIIERAAEKAYPEESCGLLAGHADETGCVVVTRVRPSANVADGDRRAAFEVDPAIRFALMRELEGTGDRIVGHYHSHPDRAPEPSARDLAMVFEPDFVWLIVQVANGRAQASRAFAVDSDGPRFYPVTIAFAPTR